MIKGKRWDNPNDEMPQPGQYGKSSNGKWYGCPPQPLDDNGFPLVANLSQHEVIEHEDGTITVSPSIQIRRLHGKGEQWHGYLERGIWREA
jgi:hypothetical protein